MIGNRRTQFGFRRLWSSASGQDLIEYALLAAFIALVVLGGVTTLGTTLNNWFGTIGSSVPGSGS